MRRILSAFLAFLAAATLAALPFLCPSPDLPPDKITGYYEQKARQEADSGDSAEAELMRLLLGGALAAEEAPSRPGFSWFGLGLALAVAAGGCVSILQGGKEKKAVGTAVLLALPLGFLGARLFFCGVNAGFFVLDLGMPQAMLRVWEGGLCLSGAMILSALAAPITAKICRKKTGSILNALAPGMLVFAAGARIVSWITGAGYGPEMDFSWPVITQLISGAPRLNTALLMALCALGIAALKKDFGRSAFLYGATLLLLESLRRDGHLLWGFVHAEQVFSLLIALAALLALTASGKRKGLALGATAAVAGIIVGLEFALDRSPISDLLLYAGYALVVGAYVWLGLRLMRGGKEKKKDV